MEIKFSNVSLTKGKKKILEDISFCIEENSITCIVGKNGAGKTSVLKLITGIEKYEGSITIDGQEISSSLISSYVSYVPQENFSNIDISLFDYVSLGIRATKPFYMPINKDDKKKINEVLERLGIIELSNRVVKTLSGGQKQKASIALALVQEKKVIIMDEPTTFLDLETIKEVIGIIKQMKKDGKSVILTLHEINYASKMTDRMIAIKDGKIFFNGKYEDLISYENMKKLYDIDPKITIIDGKPQIVDF
jgi:iron complex transport system ATP-binding protein